MITPTASASPALSPVSRTAPDPASLAARFREVRAMTERLCAPLETEDYVAQSMPDASPAKWHLAHTTWFFETFLLKPADADGRGVAPGSYAYLFNSYYNALGERIPRAKRGLITRPTVAEVYAYRAAVDEKVSDLLGRGDEDTLTHLATLLELGLNHEQQHQELILTDLKHLFSANPARPVYRESGSPEVCRPSPSRWVDGPSGVRWVGHEGAGFAFDNESPRHQEFVQPFRIASRLVTSGEYLAFMADGGYERPELWLSDGWFARGAHGWTAPLYWEADVEGAWSQFTLSGQRPVEPDEPVCHLSFYEADAFSRWAGARLPTEAEWELIACDSPVSGNVLERERFHPGPAAPTATGEVPPVSQLFGDVWEWTRSPYSPYPGYRPAEGALGEYNGKFMCNQMVLRGGSCATPASHLRATYRNFFPPEARWQFSGIRLAADA